ncbi:hypothetical protein HDU91_005287 [Kappamyces sp. JEL0680]|nr:hypothetical protein HDU91_005287 [Kappamyces sp. JEL0680]
MVHQFYGRRIYYLFIFILYGSIQSVNVASIIGSAQIFDSLMVGIFGGTCGWGVSPKTGIYCVTQIQNTNSPFGSNYMVGTVGFVVSLGAVLALVSLFYNAVYFLTLIFSVVVKGTSSTGLEGSLSAIGSDLTQVVGQVLFNFTLANTIPSWMNVKHHSVSPKKSVWYTVAIANLLYIATGFIGGIGYNVNENTNLLQAMYSDSSITKGAFGWITLLYILFPVLTYITSIPVAMIVIRLNFLAARICSPSLANWWAVWLPFIICLPLQTGNYITYFGTYTSIVFQSCCNFFAPFLIYIFLNKRNLEMAQSVLDELEFLDISAGIKKGYTEDDDFDYIYHLPSANPDRIIWRDPFQVQKLAKMTDSKKQRSVQSMSQLSNSSRHSIKEIRGMLDPTLGQKVQKRSMRRRRQSGQSSQSGQSRSQSIMGFDDNSSSRASNLMHPNALGRRQQSNPHSFADYKDSSIAPDSSYGLNDIGDDDVNLIPIMDGGGAMFRAMPDWMYKVISPNTMAIIGLVLMLAMVVQMVLAVVGV